MRYELQRGARQGQEAPRAHTGSRAGGWFQSFSELTRVKRNTAGSRSKAHSTPPPSTTPPPRHLGVLGVGDAKAAAGEAKNGFPLRGGGRGRGGGGAQGCEQGLPEAEEQP